jgi:hypothetical protein
VECFDLGAIIFLFSFFFFFSLSFPFFFRRCRKVFFSPPLVGGWRCSYQRPPRNGSRHQELIPSTEAALLLYCWNDPEQQDNDLPLQNKMLRIRGQLRVDGQS